MSGPEETTEIEPIDIAIHRDYALNFRVWLLRDFKGYASPAP